MNRIKTLLEEEIYQHACLPISSTTINRELQCYYCDDEYITQVLLNEEEYNVLLSKICVRELHDRAFDRDLINFIFKVHTDILEYELKVAYIHTVFNNNSIENVISSLREIYNFILLKRKFRGKSWARDFDIEEV